MLICVEVLLLGGCSNIDIIFITLHYSLILYFWPLFGPTRLTLKESSVSRPALTIPHDTFILQVHLQPWHSYLLADKLEFCSIPFDFLYSIRSSVVENWNHVLFQFTFCGTLPFLFHILSLA